MKEEKTWYGLNKKVPEKEWEAKYLVGLESQKVISILGFWAFSGIVLVGIMLFVSSVLSTSCTIEFEGTYSGEIDVDLQKLEVDGLKILSVDYLKGKTKVELPCITLAKAIAER